VIHVDTSFLVDLLREDARGHRGPATTFLDDIANEEIRAGVHVVCELLAGAELSRRPSAERPRVQHLCATLDIVHPDEQFPKVYGRLLAAQQRAGRPVSTMDLLIATAAVVDGAPLVTRNATDFGRIMGLEVLTY
jgi:predicted nucleic acid-binding protein